MHQTRQQATKKLPIERKGTKYVVRALSHPNDSVPVLIALRDMLKLAKTKKEVKKMIIQKLLKINGRDVRDYRESIRLFNLLHAGKDYVLKLSPVRKFFFEETKDSKERLCKVIGKKLLKNSKIQLNLHDGTNILAEKSIKIGDSVYLDLEGKIKRHVSLEKGKDAFVLSGKYMGLSGKIESVSKNQVLIKLKEGAATLPVDNIIVQ
jgi:small subunit ribosomal protein S4e